ncbi:Tyrosine-protein kinase YwqD [Posidoniimonas corsicana]|uniref:non-specific protein-tyrosine kinase n=1 Tax=Posidoniimonas corsicana TaxID=1938618 RepID=A0A5C5VHX7_9BACT|nr:polysaccharide biosynthesis tyrosine autokinase [Posidoniimonas corsicana]TWT37355.1 Tyrosine-protein kinase YwqD [Posidoniimonas corsicana]
MNDNQHGASTSENGAPDGARSREMILPQGGMPALAVGSPYAPAATQDVIKGGMDASTLMHAFRRRWLLALGMGLLAGVVGAGVLWFLFPESATAFRYFKVDASETPIIESSLNANRGDFDIYRQTQVVLIKSMRVLDSALRSGDLGDLSYFDGIEEADRSRYLAEELRVQFPQGSEVLEIRLSGAAPAEELKEIVEAVSKAYLDEVIFEDKIQRQKPRDILVASYRDLDEEIKRKTDAFMALLKDSESPLIYLMGGAGGGDPELAQFRSAMNESVKKLASLESELMNVTIQYEIMTRQYQDPSVLEQRIEQALEADPKYQYLKQKKLSYEMYIMDMEAVQSNRGSNAQVRQLQKQANATAQQLEQYRQQMTAAMKSESRKEADPYIKALQTDYTIRRQGLMQQIQQAKKQQEAMLEKLRERSEVDTDLLARQAEIEGLKMVQAGIAERIEHWDVELKRPDRVLAFGGVDTSENINKTERYAISALGGLTCLGLVMFGVSYMEFRNRKLNGPDQVDQGLGIRVVGTLPSLSGRRALDPSHPVVAQLTESIDSVRTALMHESTTKRRQIVLVTSPSTLEGRTTVSSQLAASLARAGRRTLLIDGDMRHPALHTLFDLPLEDGLCEVLRAEVEVSDVVRPTHAEGLWVLTAGYCDADAVHALATDQVQPIFEKLRAEYDFIIIDGAPVLGLSDSLLFGQHCDGAILSVLRDHTTLPKIHQAAELLRSVGIRLVGSVINGMPSTADRRITALQSVTAKSDLKQLESVES